MSAHHHRICQQTIWRDYVGFIGRGKLLIMTEGFVSSGVAKIKYLTLVRNRTPKKSNLVIVTEKHVT